MANIKELLGKRIREIRQKRSITQEKLAELTGISPRSLRRIENGDNFLTAETLEKLTYHLKVEPKEFFDFNHLRKKQDLQREIIEKLNQNQEKLGDIYKIVDALTKD